MSKMKKILLTCIAYSLVAVLAITGTIAYLTDRDSEVNTFTVGDVAIDLIEDFEQGAELVPGVKIEKGVTIENVGNNDAWVWYTYAVPTALINTDANASKNAIHFNIPGRYWDSYRENTKYWEDGQTEAVAYENTWHWEEMEVDALEKDGVKYTVVSVLYNGTLEKGEVTTLGLEQVYLDTHVDIDPNGDWYWVENGDATSLNWNTETNGAPRIYVSAYAIQAEGFATVSEAYAAYNTQWGENGTEYASPTIEVASVEELDEAIANAPADGVVVLKNSIDFGNSTYTINKSVVINLNGNTLSSSARNGTIYAKGGCTIKNGTIEHKGTVAGIKVWQAEAIEDVTVVLGGKSSAGNAITGISVQAGTDTYIGSLKDVTVVSTGDNKTYNGIETYNCGNRTDLVISSMENVKVDVNGTALVLSAPVGTAVNCEFKGGVYGINAHLKGTFNVSLNLVNCTVSGGTRGIYISDELPTGNSGYMNISAENTAVVGGVEQVQNETFDDRWSVTGLQS